MRRSHGSEYVLSRRGVLRAGILGAAALVSPSLLAACSSGTTSNGTVGTSVRVNGGSYTDINPDDLKSMLDDKDFLFVNTHIPFEGDIPQTDLTIPFDQIQQNLDQLLEDKDAKVVLYCRSDRMSRIAAEELVGMGYTNIWNLDGGFNAWKNAGYPMEGTP